MYTISTLDGVSEQIQRIASLESDSTSAALEMMQLARSLIFIAEKKLSASTEGRMAEGLSNLDLVKQVDDLERRARKAYLARRVRDRIFDSPELFGEPCWDILLDLFAAEKSDQPISITSACIASNVPATTALRWIGLLEDKGMVKRVSDPMDARRRYLRLTDTCRSMISRYLFEVSDRGL